MPNFLPLLALAGGIAYIVSKKKQESVCPSRIKIDEAEIQSQAAEKLGNLIREQMQEGGFDPKKMADEFFSLFAPIECKNSKSIIVFKDQEVVASELYAQLLMQFEAGKKILDVFNSFAGEKCPRSVIMGPEHNVEIHKIFDNVTKDQDPIELTDRVFSFFAPIECKWDDGMLIHMEDLDREASAPVVWVAILADLLEEYWEILPEAELNAIFDGVLAEFKTRTGRDWKDPIGA